MLDFCELAFFVCAVLDSVTRSSIDLSESSVWRESSMQKSLPRLMNVFLGSMSDSGSGFFRVELSSDF